MLPVYRGKKPIGTSLDPEVQQLLVYQDILEGQSSHWYGRGLVQLSNCAVLGSLKNSMDL
jgi:hypothetical protein